MNSGRATSIGAASIALAACLAFAGGCNRKQCSGIITCANQAAQCDKVPGCQPTPACQYSFGNVDSTCRKLTMPETCAAETTSACLWTAPECVSACGAITDAQACQDFSFTDPRFPEKFFPCVWSTCSGIPEKASCDDYPVDQCPSYLGCQVTQPEPVGT
jgi:hypothetical protein